MNIHFILDKRGYVFLQKFLERDHCGRVSYKIVQSCGLRSGLMNILKFSMKMFFGTVQSVLSILSVYIGSGKKLIKKKEMRKIYCIGFGGYSSFPPVISTRILSCFFSAKVFLHQSDIVLGKANKFLARFANKVFLGLKDMKNLRSNCDSKFIHVGIPVREMFLTKERRDILEESVISDDKNFLRLLNELNFNSVAGEENFRNRQNDEAFYDKCDVQFLKILAIGGSQSAAMWSDVLPEVVRLLPVRLKKIVKITQQCGGLNPEDVKNKYVLAGLIEENVKILDFIENIAGEMENANVIFARAGASTIAECAFMKKPSVYVPYKFAAQNHQMKNAEFIQENCGGWVVHDNWSEEKILFLAII